MTKRKGHIAGPEIKNFVLDLNARDGRGQAVEQTDDRYFVMSVERIYALNNKIGYTNADHVYVT